MTTAHRPTWQAAKGGEEQGGQRIFAPSRMTSAKDQASHTKLKFRWDSVYNEPHRGLSHPFRCLQPTPSLNACRQPGQGGAAAFTKADLKV